MYIIGSSLCHIWSVKATPLRYSPNSTWVVTSRLDTTRYVRRVERAETSVSICVVRQARHSQNAWAWHVERVKSCRDVTWRAKWNLGLRCTHSNQCWQLGGLGVGRPPQRKWKKTFATVVKVFFQTSPSWEWSEMYIWNKGRPTVYGWQICTSISWGGGWFEGG